MKSRPTLKRILVFGSTGTGKTTLINKLAETNMETSNSAKGVTMSWTKVDADHMDDKVRFWKFVVHFFVVRGAALLYTKYCIIVNLVLL